MSWVRVALFSRVTLLSVFSFSLEIPKNSKNNSSFVLFRFSAPLVTLFKPEDFRVRYNSGLELTVEGGRAGLEVNLCASPF